MPPRLWRPGALWVGDRQVLHGASVGWTDYPGEIVEWKKEIWLVDKRTIPAGAKRPPCPEDKLGAGRWGRVRQAALSTPVVVVPAHEAVALAGLGARVITIGWHRGSGGGNLVVQQGDLRLEFGGSLDEVERAPPKPQPRLRPVTDEEPVDDEQPVNFDRLLRAFTRGEVSEADVVLADTLSWATADGGPRLDAWEAWLAEIFTRAEAHAADIDAVIAALHPVDKSGTVVTSWAPIQAGTLMPIEIVLGAGQRIELPRETYFTVDGVADWTPTLPQPFQIRLPKEPSEHRGRIWLAVILTVAGALWYLAHR